MSRTGKLCFAYGSNLCLEQMKERCPHAAPLLGAVLAGHRFLINSRGVGTIAPDPEKRVFGLLWRLTPQDEVNLDAYEGVGRGLYRKTFVYVTPLRGLGRVRAFAYVAADAMPGEPRGGYLEGILRAAEVQGFPRAYVEELRAWGIDQALIAVKNIQTVRFKKGLER